MERTRTSPASNSRTSRIERQLAPLKLVSRLLGHELHAQQSPRLTLSRDEILEIQTTLDLYIEVVLRAGKATSGGASAGPSGDYEVQAVPTRVN